MWMTWKTLRVYLKIIFHIFSIFFLPIFTFLPISHFPRQNSGVSGLFARSTEIRTKPRGSSRQKIRSPEPRPIFPYKKCTKGPRLLIFAFSSEFFCIMSS